jgi:hypothetical protein
MDGEPQLEELIRWMETWDRVCAAADPGDGPLPAWEDVRRGITPLYP